MVNILYYNNGSKLRKQMRYINIFHEAISKATCTKAETKGEKMDAEYTGQFEWEYLEEGPEVWRVAIGKK